MDFSWSAEQRALRDSLVKFARRNLTSEALAEREGVFPHQAWRQCAEVGLLGLPLPSQYGGSDCDLLTITFAMEGLGSVCRDNGLLFALNAHIWSVEMPILHFGSPEQKARYLPDLCAGTLMGAHAITEAEAGSDVAALRTRAVRQGETYVLTGCKQFITNAPLAGVFVVLATVDPALGVGGLTAFLVERATRGLVVGKNMDKMGLASATMAEVSLDACVLPASQRLGPEGAGMALFSTTMQWERCCILASHLGAMDRQLEGCVAYARTRKQFDQPIGKFQMISSRLADMKVRLETARMLVYRAAWLLQQNKPAMLESAVAKLYTSESFVQSSLDAIQIYGAYGYMTESGVEQDLRDAIAGRVYSGTSEVQRLTIARWLGL